MSAVYFHLSRKDHQEKELIVAVNNIEENFTYQLHVCVSCIVCPCRVVVMCHIIKSTVW